jgi:AAA+ ATPase superfamily predicted ATPase
MEFVNRAAELRELNAAAKHGGLLVMFGRRRVGKTRLLRQWLSARDGLYSQAIEAQRDLQIQQVFADQLPQFETQLVPKT